MLGLVSLVAQGARAYARGRSRREAQNTYRELSAVEDPSLASTTAPARVELIEEIRTALTDALPEGWSVDDLLIGSPAGPQLQIEIEQPGVMTRRGNSEGCTVPIYWLIAPVGPTITVLAFQNGGYDETARVTAETYTATEPFPVTIPLQAR